MSIVELGAHSNMSTEDTVALVGREKWIDVIVCGYQWLNGKEEFIVRSSAMNRKDALWLAKQLELHALDRL